MSEVKLIINQLNDAPHLFIDGQEVKGIVSIDYKYVSNTDVPGAHQYTIKYFDDLDKDKFKQDPTIKTIAVQRVLTGECHVVNKNQDEYMFSKVARLLEDALNQKEGSE